MHLLFGIQKKTSLTIKERRKRIIKNAFVLIAGIIYIHECAFQLVPLTTKNTHVDDIVVNNIEIIDLRWQYAHLYLFSNKGKYIVYVNDFWKTREEIRNAVDRMMKEDCLTITVCKEKLFLHFEPVVVDIRTDTSVYCDIRLEKDHRKKQLPLGLAIIVFAVLVGLILIRI